MTKTCNHDNSYYRNTPYCSECDRNSFHQWAEQYWQINSDDIMCHTCQERCFNDAPYCEYCESQDFDDWIYTHWRHV